MVCDERAQASPLGPPAHQYCPALLDHRVDLLLHLAEEDPKARAERTKDTRFLNSFLVIRTIELCTMTERT